MKTYNLFTNQESSLPKAKADLLLLSKNRSDKEFLEARDISSFSIAETNPIIITKAIHNLDPFSSIEVLDLESSDAIDAKDIFAKGMEYGRSYELKGNYLILADADPQANIDAIASALALGYETPHFSYNEYVSKVLASVSDEMSSFEKLSKTADATLMFCAGFLLEATKRFHVVLGGGVDMSVVLLIADKLREDVLMRIKHDNLTFATASWSLNVANSDIKQLLTQLSYTPNALCTDFSFENSEIDSLKKYDDNKIQESSGSGAALAYGVTNSLTQEALLNEIEIIIYSM